MPHEPDGVAHRVDAAVGGGGAPGGRVERREQRVLDEHPGGGQPVEQAGLAGVGVAGDGHAGDLVGLPLAALGVAGDLHALELATELGDAVVDAAPVGLDLGLTGATTTDAVTAGGPATGLAGEVATPAAQALLHVLQLRQLDLGLALLGLRVLGEDVEDQRGPVDDLDLEPVLEVPQLAGRELTVADDGVGAGRPDDLADRLDLAAADVRRRVGALPALVDRLEHLRAGGLGEQRELGHGVLGVLRRALGPDAHEHHPLQSQLAVLDLGDVLELGAQAGHAAQLVALGELHRADRRLLGVGLVGVPGLEPVGLVSGLVGGVVLPGVGLLQLVGEREAVGEVRGGVTCVAHIPPE